MDKNKGKTKLLESQGCNILLLVILLYVLIFTIPSISAIDINPFAKTLAVEKNINNIDNAFLKETFNLKYGNIKISNTLFWFETDKIAEYTLTGTTEQCLINCQSEGRAVLYQDGKLFDDANFKDIKGKNINLKDVQYYIKITETYKEQVPVYDTICENKEGLKCSNTLESYKTETRIKTYWKEYNFEELKAGNYEWKIEGKKNINQKIDFIPIAQGKSLDEWVWWDSSWTRKQLISINTTQTINNASILINITYDSDMQNDFDDLRFVDGATETTELGYWFYNNTYRDSNSVQVWLNISYITPATNMTIYMYYDNPIVTTTSNITKAFQFADDFNGASVDFTNNWVSANTALYTTSGGIMSAATAASANIMTTNKPYSNFMLEARVGTNDVTIADLYFDMSPTRSAFAGNDGEKIGNSLFKIQITGAAQTIGTPINNNFYRFEIKHLVGGVMSGNITYDNKSIALSHSANPTNSIIYPAILRYSGGVGYMDWIYIRGFTTAEPTYTFSVEETGGGLPISITTTLISPNNGYSSTNNQNYFSANYTVTGGNLSNGTLFIWDNTGVFIGFNNTYINGTFNSTNLSYYLPIGNYKWNYIAEVVNTSSKVYSSALLNRTINIAAGKINYYNYSNSSYETDLNHFDINITSYAGVPSNVKLLYNGVSYDGTITNIGGNDYRLASDIYIPLTTSQMVENKTWYFSFDISSVNQISTMINQTVNPIRLNLCNSTLNINYVNFTFKDQTTTTKINETFNSLLQYYLSSSNGFIKRNLSFINISYNENYPFCFDPVNRSIIINITTSYYGDGYPLRTFVNNSMLLTNITFNQILYSVSSVSGIYTTFQVINQANQPISGVYTTVETQIGGVWTIIGTGTTGDDGGVTFFVDPNYQHKFTFSKIGYDTYTTTITPTQSSYTITLGGISTGGTILDYNEGISYSLTPIDFYLNNMTNYQFSFNIKSTYWDLDSWGFNLLGNGTNLIGVNSSTTGTGGVIYYNVSTGQNKSIVMNYWWIINSTNFNGTKTWTIINTFDDGWSIKNFFDDLKTYTDAGIFGLDAFGRTILIFLFIFVIIGMISYSSGTYSIGAILVELSFLVFLFDGILGLIPNPSPFPKFPTILIFLLTIGYLFQEWRR